MAEGMTAYGRVRLPSGALVARQHDGADWREAFGKLRASLAEGEELLQVAKWPLSGDEPENDG